MYNCDMVFDEIDRLEDKYIDFWKCICSIESPTDYKEGLDNVGLEIVRKAQECGFETEIISQDKAGDLVKITLNNNSQLKPIILSAHIDTVHPVGSFGNPPVRVDSEKIYGPGVADDKGGAAAAIYAMEALKNCGYTGRNVIFIAQTDEEVSSTVSNGATIDYICGEAKKCEAFINLESLHKGKAILSRKGIARYRVNVTGKVAHSARCFLGSNAVLEAAHKIIDIEKYKDADSITCNCSMISGGEVANSVPDECGFTVDVRYFSDEQYKYIDGELRKIADKSYIGDTRCSITCVSRRPAMEINERNLEFLKKMNRIYKQNGMEELEADVSLGGSDAANVSACGVAVVDSIGCEGGKIHSIEEFAYLKSLNEAARRIASVIYCFD